jgi:hypothetical protein
MQARGQRLHEILRVYDAFPMLHHEDIFRLESIWQEEGKEI